MTHGPDGYPFSDLALARRLERAEGRANAAFAEARAELQPESGAAWAEIAGAYAILDGAESPVTQSFGLGLFDPVGAPEMEAIEEFFRARGAPVAHEVSPLADAALFALLRERGYLPVEFHSVLYRPTVTANGLPEPPREERIRARRIGPEKADVWAEIAAEGWSSVSAEIADFVRELGALNARRAGTDCFLAELEERPIAAATLSINEGVALLSGATTIPAARGQGAQRALLEARLRFAAAQGCDLAMMVAVPGSASQRNAERQGFRIAYTRSKWQLQTETQRRS